jgi:hypothetical protein
MPFTVWLFGSGVTRVLSVELFGRAAIHVLNAVLIGSVEN